jgi:hypothetical protein
MTSAFACAAVSFLHPSSVTRIVYVSRACRYRAAHVAETPLSIEFCTRSPELALSGSSSQRC